MEAISIPSPSAFLQSPVAGQPSSTVTATTASVSVPQQHGNAKRKASSMASSKPKAVKTKASGGGGVTKPKQSKSRNGCVTCKAKRLKCDESKPTCQQCHKRNVDCGGYKKDFKWRSFEEATFASKPSPASTRGKKPSTSVKQEFSPHSHSPSPSDASGSTATPIQLPSTPHTTISSIQNYSPLQTHSRIPTLVHQSSSNGSYHDAFNYVPDRRLQPISQSTYVDTSRHSEPTNANLNSSYDEGGLNPTTTAPSSYSSGQSPRLIDLLLPGTDLSPPPDYMSLRPQQSDVPYQPEGIPLVREECQTLDEDEIEDIKRDRGPMVDDWHFRGGSPTLSSTKSDSPGLDVPTFMFNQPVLSPGSPELLIKSFNQATCGILSVRDGPNENPWRTAIFPLARDSPALLHAISSMTAFHSSKYKPEMKVEGIEHMKSSIQHLVSGIANMRVDAALATTLVLAFAESWDVHVSTGIQHLQGAKILVNQALVTTRQNNLSAAETARIKFLCNVWIYMDVIARLTSNNDELDDTDTLLWSQVDPHGNSVEIDPLMGCASTLFPIIGRVANLVRKVRKTTSNSINIVSQAIDLKTELESWQPPSYFNQPEDPTCEIRDSLQTAEAYRWATLLYLHQAVPEIPSRTAGQLAKKVLVYLATVPLTSRTIIVQIYPLLAAGCEARSEEDRNWVRERWTVMSQRMQIGNIDRCLEVVKEVWDRRDSAKAAGHGTGRSGRAQCGQMPFVANSAFALSSPSHVRKASFSFDHDDVAGDWDPMTTTPFNGKWRAIIGEHGTPTAVRLGPNGASALEEQQGYWDQASASRHHSVRSRAQDALPMAMSSQTNISSLEDRNGGGVLVDWPDELDEEQIQRAIDAQGRMKAGLLHARKGSLEARHDLDRERTVRGNQHWVGVMKDWKWEVLLG